MNIFKNIYVSIFLGMILATVDIRLGWVFFGSLIFISETRITLLEGK